MADKKKPAKKPVRVLKKTQSVRERAEKATAPKKVRRLHTTAGAAAKPFKAAHKIGKKEFYLPLPNSKVGNFLNKRRSAVPRYFVLAWKELRQVVWPNRKETAKLTVAVFMFAIFFGALITLVDYGLDKLFKQVILK